MSSGVSTGYGQKPSMPTDCSLLFVDNVVPDAATFRNPGFSWAGYVVQLGLLEGMVALGISSTRAISAPPMVALGNGGSIWAPGVRTRTRGATLNLSALTRAGFHTIRRAKSTFVSLSCN
jgi:hypothetical protein